MIFSLNFTGATVTVVVKDKDVFGSDDFMGQIVLPLSHYADGKDHHILEQLRDEVTCGHCYFPLLFLNFFYFRITLKWRMMIAEKLKYDLG